MKRRAFVTGFAGLLAAPLAAGVSVQTRREVADSRCEA